MVSETTTLLPSAPLRYNTHTAYYNAREELTSDSEGESDMGDLSDSPSSHPSSSRPTTPSHTPSTISDSPISPPRLVRQSASPPAEGPLCLAHKAERILGLIPGTLPYAEACLEHAKETVRRTADDVSIDPAQTGMRSRFDRARKAMSIQLNNRVPGVIVGAGGVEEEERRERRRRATDGVIYWQREVARLREADEAQRKTVRGKGRR